MAGERVRGSCGLPLPYTRVRAINADGRELPAGQTGVLAVRGPNVGPGYTEAERNAEVSLRDGEETFEVGIGAGNDHRSNRHFLGKQVERQDQRERH